GGVLVADDDDERRVERRVLPPAGVGLEAQALDHVVPEHLQDRVQVRRVEGAVEAAERLHVGVEGVRRPVPGALKFLGRRGGGQRTADVHGGGPPALPFRALRDGDGEGRAGAVAVHGEGAADAVEDRGGDAGGRPPGLPFRALRDGDGEGRAGAVAVNGEGAADAVEDLGGDQVGRLVQAEEGFAAGVGRVVAGQCGAPGRDAGGQFGGEVVVGGGGAAAVRHADQGQGGVVRGRGEGAQDRSPSGVVELPHAPGQPLGCGVLEDVEDLDAPADGPG